MKSNTRVRAANLTSSPADASSDRIRNWSSSFSCTLLVQGLLLIRCCLSVGGVLCGLIALIAQCSRDLAPDVGLQISLLLSAVTELNLQALHMTLVSDSFLEGT